MKKTIIFMLLACMLAGGMFIQTTKQLKLKDGLYLVDKVVYNPNDISLKANQAFVLFNKDFLESAPDSAKGLVINTADFVPLLLDKEPQLLPQTENSEKLELTFSQPAAEKLEHFTEKNVMKQAALVVNGEALTTQKIRDAIRGGKMEITHNDDACQRIYVFLKNNMAKNR